MKYLVLYYNDSTIDVFDLDQGMEYIHRMRLPKYKKYKDYVFKFYGNNISPKRDFFETTLSVMMTNPLDNQTVFLVYKLDEPQHNALFISSTCISEQL
jgi:hypothetical protein